MTQPEHLALILAHCRRCLALAEKRTPGKWVPNDGQTSDEVCYEDTEAPSYFIPLASVEKNENVHFIAECAGSAEAGWRATISAIEGLLSCNDQACDNDGMGCRCVERAESALAEICAAYPLELLQTK